MSICVFIASKVLSTSMINAQDLHFARFRIPNIWSPICATRKTYLYIPRTVRYADKRRAREAKFYFDPFGRLEDGRNLHRESSRLNTLRGNVAYYFSQLRKQLWIVTRVWNFNAKTFERAIKTDADPYARHSSCIHLKITRAFQRYIF